MASATESSSEDEIIVHEYSIPQELTKYLFTKILAKEINMWKWWKKHEREFPILFAFTCQYSSVLATSASFGKCFSSTTLTVKKLRSGLSCKYLEERNVFHCYTFCVIKLKCCCVYGAFLFVFKQIQSAFIVFVLVFILDLAGCNGITSHGYQ